MKDDQRGVNAGHHLEGPGWSMAFRNVCGNSRTAVFTGSQSYVNTITA